MLANQNELTISFYGPCSLSLETYVWVFLIIVFKNLFVPIHYKYLNSNNNIILDIENFLCCLQLTRKYFDYLKLKLLIRSKSD